MQHNILKINNTNDEKNKLDITDEEKKEYNKILLEINGLTENDKIDKKEELSINNGDFSELSKQKINRYFYLCELLIDEIREKDPIKVEKIVSYLSNIAENNKNLNFVRRIILIQNEILNLTYNGDYKKISKKFPKYIDYINNLIEEIDYGDKLEKIIKLDLLTFLFINLSLCVFDDDTHRINNKLGVDILEKLEENGLIRHQLLVKQYLYKSSLQNSYGGKDSYIFDLESIISDVKYLKEKKYPINSLNFSCKDNYQFLITKLEYLITNNINNEKEIEETIKEIEENKKEELDLKIHFLYLKAIYYKQKGNNINNEKEKVKEDTIGIIENNKKEVQENNISKAKKILLYLLEDNSDIENKIWLVNPLLLLIELETNQNKKIEYFFTAYGYVEKHFGTIDNFYKEKLTKISKEIFPGLKLDFIDLLYKNYTKEKKINNEDEAISGQNLGNISIEDLLKENFGIEEVLIFKKNSKKIITSFGFSESDKEKNNPGILIEENTYNKLNKNKWEKVKINNDSIHGIINSNFFSETLVGKIITIGEEEIVVFISRGRKNKTKFNLEDQKELSRIELIYIKNILNNQIIDEKTEELITKNKKLEEDKELRQLLLSIYNHDVNNPLYVVMGNLELLEDDIIKLKELLEDGKYKLIMKKIESMKISSSRVNDIIIKMVNIFNKDIESFIEIEINRFLKDNISSQEFFATKHNIKIKYEGIGKNLYFDGIYSKLNSIIENIIGNAIKSIIKNPNINTENKGKIIISVTNNENDLIIKISDNGEGIEDKNNLTKIFEKNVQLGDKTSEKKLKVGGQSKGIGLSTVKKYIEDHNGTITAESDGKNLGATFTITIPIKQN